jgi:hypothetical protein
MRLFVDLDTLVVSDYQNAALSAITARRSDRFPVHVRFQRGGVVQELPYGATGKIVLKKISDFSGYPVAWSPGWRKLGYGTGSYYAFQLDLFTRQVVDQFLSLQGELPSIALAMEIQWGYRGTRRASRAVPFTIENDYVRLEDAEEPPEPIEVPPPAP